MKTRDRILEILKELNEEVDYDSENELVTGGIFDSFDVINIVGRLNEEFGITLEIENVIVQNFDSLNAMTKMIEGIIK